MERPQIGRAKITETIRDFIIEIPAKKNWFVIIFMTGWLGGWLMGELFALGTVSGLFGFGDDVGGASLFILFWLIAWTAGGLMAMRMWLWMVIGKEVLSFGNKTLKVSKKGALFSKNKEYDLKECKHFRINPNSSSDFFGSQQRNSFNLGGNGAIQFDYGLKTIKIAGGIDEAEAKHIINTLESKRIVNQENTSF